MSIVFIIRLLNFSSSQVADFSACIFISAFILTMAPASSCFCIFSSNLTSLAIFLVSFSICLASFISCLLNFDFSLAFFNPSNCAWLSFLFGLPVFLLISTSASAFSNICSWDFSIGSSTSGSISSTGSSIFGWGSNTSLLTFSIISTSANLSSSILGSTDIYIYIRKKIKLF